MEAVIGLSRNRRGFVGWHALLWGIRAEDHQSLTIAGTLASEQSEKMLSQLSALTLTTIAIGALVVCAVFGYTSIDEK